MNWAKSIIITIIIMIPFSFFIHFYSESYRNATEEYQNIYFAIGVALAGIFFHFGKNHESMKGKKATRMMIECFELLLLVMAPTTISFTILKQIFPSSIIPILIIFAIVASGWYFVTLYRASRIEDKTDGRPTFVLANLIYGSFLTIIVLGGYLSML